MADAILNHLSATNLFDLEGVIIVITGGGTASLISAFLKISFCSAMADLMSIGNWFNDCHNFSRQWSDSIHYWPQAG